MLSKSQLGMKLSALSPFSSPKRHLEQYPTDSEVAAELLHNAQMLDDIKDKHITDLGAGTGMLGIGCLLLGAKHVTFLDIDDIALHILQQNLDKLELSGNASLKHQALQVVSADTAVMNPPFGTQRSHADRDFLIAAMQSAPVVYSLHLSGSEGFVDALAASYGYRRTHTWDFQMPLKQSMPGHKRKIERVPVIAVRLENNPL